MKTSTGRRVLGWVATLAVAGLLAGCASGRAFGRGEEAARAGDWEAAVGFYRQALQSDPDRPDFKIALERALIAAAGQYADRARQYEAANQHEEALRAYRKALEFEPSNRQLATKASEIERMLRERIEAATPRPEIERLREQARRSAEPVLNPTSREPLIFNFANTSAREILQFIGSYAGINVTFDRDFADRPVSVKLDGVTLEQALQQLMLANGYFYKVLNERTIIIAVESVAKRNQYEEQVIRTFYLSHADANDVFTLLNSVVRIAGQAVLPTFSPNKTANTITVRATAAVVQIVERVIESIDKPRAEVIVDVQILEVSRERTKQYGLSLSDYAIGTAFSPERAPAEDASSLFNVNTISSGVSPADFYMSVPSAVVRFLESDSQTKVLAKPQLRGSEGQKLTLNLGEDVPVPSTTFTPLAAGGATTNPLTSYGYRTIGIIVEMEPRVTYENEVILNISVENSARGQDTNIAGQNLPSFFSRKVTTRLRLRDGESNLLAGLLREDERRSLRGFPGILRLPIVKQLFSDNDQNIRQTDIVMLLTPRIIRTHELRAKDLSPIYIGTQGNLALGGPPPVIGGAASIENLAPTEPAPAVAPTPGAPGYPGAKPPIQPVLPTGATAFPTVPAGSSPIPGMTPAPPAPATPPPNPVVSTPPPAEPVPNPAAQAPVPPTPPPAPVTPAPTAPIPGAARISLSPPGEMRVGGGPYLVPISIIGATRLSTVTTAITYNPAMVRVRNVQEGNFMRQGGANPTFTQQVDAANGRIDIAIARAADQTGASTTGLLAALLLEPIAAGTSALSVSGSGSMPGGAGAALQFLSATVTVK